MNEKSCILIETSPEFPPMGLIDNDKTALGDGLAPNRRQPITWTNVDTFNWRIYAALGGGELKYKDTLDEESKYT